MKRYAWLLLIGLVLTTAGNAALAQQGNDDRPQASNLAERTPWTNSQIHGSPEPPAPYETQRVFSKLEFLNPVELVTAPGSDRLFLAQVDGKIFSFPDRKDATQADLFGDLSSHGIKDFSRLYSLVFHPDFEKNRYVYVVYVLKADIEDGTKVSRFKVTEDDPPRLMPESETVMLTWVSGGHNGSCLKFGPDGFLYIATGDASGPFPPDSLGAGQSLDDLLSSILRIDVDHAQGETPYSSPADNPFVDVEGARGEVWTYGHRNPWKMHFDPKTGALWVGDVGWEMWEMIYRIEKGANYGWSIVEATQSVNPEWKRGPTPIVPATIAHSHTEARSITGGTVYHGKRLPELQNTYIYGDYVTGKIWGAKLDGSSVGEPRELVDTPLQVICFGVDHDGELLIVDYQGTIHRLASNPAHGRNSDFPKQLSGTGLFASVKDQLPAPGVYRYSINAEPWEDGAVALRFVAVPGKQAVEASNVNDFAFGVLKGEPRFPEDTVFVKTLALEVERGNPFSLRKLETQILHNDGQTWQPYTYIWNDEQTDATLAGKQSSDRTFTVVDPSSAFGKRYQTWHFASRAECTLCHTTRAGSIHGFTAMQLNREHRYAAGVSNQLERLIDLGLLPASTNRKTRPLASPNDPWTPIGERARAYLHVNCAHCHRRGGGGTASFDVTYNNSLEKTGLLDARPTQGTFGIYGAQVISAGAPTRSVLWYRMAKLGRGRMPHFGSTVVDKAGTALIHNWIGGMPKRTAYSPQLTKEQAHQEKLLAVLRRAYGDSPKPDNARKAIDSLLADPAGAMLLLRAVETNSLKPSGSSEVVRRAVAHGDARVRDLFEQFVPEEQRTQRLGSVVKSEQILAIEGNADSGRRLFETGIGVSCRNCHKIGNLGKEFGADLSTIAKDQTRVHILESILEPSKVVDQKYLNYLVETTEGKVHSGLLVRRTDAVVVLKNAELKELRIDVDDIETIVPQQKSLMPELLLRDMTARQVADLLAYLARQR